MVADPDPLDPPDPHVADAARVVATEFGTVVLHARGADDRMVVSGGEEPLARGRCWRCDAPPRTALDDAGLCPPCGQALRDPPRGRA